MYPHERSLVKKFSNRPFAIIGVNSDTSKIELKKAIAKEKITWRSFFDGGVIGGPIATQWGVRGWPTLYVIDHKGVIRFKDRRGEELESAIDKLVAEAEAAAK